MSKSETQLPETILTNAEALERFKAVSQFILDFQKQYFESLKFSLNMWMVINSGVAIALIGAGNPSNMPNIFGFLLGALAAGIGNMMLFVFSKDCLVVSYNFTSDINLKPHELASNLSEKYTKMYWRAALSLSVSYGAFFISAVLLRLPL